MVLNDIWRCLGAWDLIVFLHFVHTVIVSKLGFLPLKTTKLRFPRPTKRGRDNSTSGDRPPGAFEVRRERRRDVRVPVCVRSAGADEDIVSSRNASRGGLCFESTRQYPKGAKIEVAIPYTHGGGNIFLAGNVVHVQKDRGGELTLYGVSYIRRPAG
jgi:PilZ domain